MKRLSTLDVRNEVELGMLVPLAWRPIDCAKDLVRRGPRFWVEKVTR